MVLEVCCFSPKAVHVAVASGVQRIEFCRERGLDGCSPLMEDVLAVAEAATTIHLMVRPQPSASMQECGPAVFVLAEDQKQWCLDYIHSVGMLGRRPAMRGVVVGALVVGDDGLYTVDWDFLRDVVAAARRIGIIDVTFHRAIDFVGTSAVALPSVETDANIGQTMDRLASLGVRRILTAGTTENASPHNLLQRVDRFKAMRSSSLAIQTLMLRVMPAGGITAATIATIRAMDGTDFIQDYHGSFLTDATAAAIPDEHLMLEALKLLEN